MKKKFLALALAAAVMAPTTSAFASQTVGGADTGTYNADVQVNGSVQKKDGSAPVGKIEVELPLATSFTVDKDGNFTGSNFTVENKGGTDVNLTVASFTEADPTGGITLDGTLTNATAATTSRDKVRLGLQHTVGGAVGGFELNTTVNNRSVGTIAAGNSATIAITGIAGTEKQDTTTSSDHAVEATGATETFTLRFRIQKA